MTRKDYALIADALRRAFPEPSYAGGGGLASDYYAGRVRGCERVAVTVEQVLAKHNDRFDSDSFGRASGRIIRSDGSMFPSGV